MTDSPPEEDSRTLSDQALAGLVAEHGDDACQELQRGMIVAKEQRSLEAVQKSKERKERRWKDKPEERKSALVKKLLFSELQEILIASGVALAEMRTEELKAYVIVNIEITNEKLSSIIDGKFHFSRSIELLHWLINGRLFLSTAGQTTCIA
jgi:hypothetical protein